MRLGSLVSPIPGRRARTGGYSRVVTNDVLTPDLAPARLSALRAQVADLMPALRQDLEALARIPSVSLAAFDQSQVDARAQAVAALRRSAGLQVEIIGL